MHFRFRSADRDSRSDSDRLRVIVTTVEKALAEAEAEKTGLAKRVEDARLNVASLLGIDEDDYLMRDERTETQLVAAEKRLISAERRIKELTSHILHIRSILAESSKGPNPSSEGST